MFYLPHFDPMKVFHLSYLGPRSLHLEGLMTCPNRDN